MDALVPVAIAMVAGDAAALRGRSFATRPTDSRGMAWYVDWHPRLASWSTRWIRHLHQERFLQRTATVAIIFMAAGTGLLVELAWRQP